METSKKKKLKGFKEHDPSKYIETEPTIEEAAKTGTAVVAWGRMNPITSGHEKLVKKVVSVAKSEKGVPEIYLTHSFDNKKNPLTYTDKIRLAQKAFGPVVKKSNAKTIFDLMAQLNKKYNKVVLVAGSDRVDEFSNTLQKYNGKEYKFDEIKVVSAGQRDEESDDVSGISGTKMRGYAATDMKKFTGDEESDDVSGISGTKMRGYAATDMKKFTANLPKRLKGDAEEIAAAVRKGMGMTEEVEILDEVLSRRGRIKKALAMKRARAKIKLGRERAARRRATMPVLRKRARKRALALLKQKYSKHKRYSDLSPAEKEIIDKRIAKISRSRIERIAQKQLIHVKRADRDRFMTVKKESEEILKFSDFLSEASQKDTRILSRPHMLMDKDNKPKFDARFKFFKKLAMFGEDLEEFDIENIVELMETTENFAEEWVCGKCNCEPCTCENITETKTQRSLSSILRRG